MDSPANEFPIFSAIYILINSVEKAISRIKALETLMRNWSKSHESKHTTGMQHNYCQLGFRGRE